MDERLRVGSLFSGIGGFDIGLEWTGGFRTVWFCEQNEFCQRILRKHWRGVPVYPDVCALRGADVEPVDVLCGGFPCQDVSVAGKGAGLDGARSGLWSEFARLIGELRPRYVLVENVSALLGRGFGRVLGDLSALGYDAEWDCIPASAVGAPHQRDRVWLVAYPNGDGVRLESERDQRSERREPAPERGHAVAVHDGAPQPVADAARDVSAGSAPAGTLWQRDWQGGESGGTGCWLCEWAEEHYLERGGAAGGLVGWYEGFSARHDCSGFPDSDSWRRKGIRIEDVARLEREARAVADRRGGAWTHVADPTGARHEGRSQSGGPGGGRRPITGGRGEEVADTDCAGLEGLGADAGEPEQSGPWDRGSPGAGIALSDRWAVEPELCGMADGTTERLDGTLNAGSLDLANGRWAAEWPGVPRVAYGIPDRVERLRALGNALVPQIVTFVGHRILEYERGF